MEQQDLQLAMLQVHYGLCQHHENLRTSVVGIALTISGILVGIVFADNAIDGGDCVVAMLLTLSGVIGLTMSVKHYERYCYHRARYREFRRALDSSVCDGSIREIEGAAQRNHEQDYPRLSRWRVNWFWNALFVLVILVGAATTVVAILRS